MWLILTISQENSEGKTLAPTPRSATAREMMKALILVRSRRLPQTRKIIELFPAAATMDSVQPRSVNQVSIHNFSLELSNTEEIVFVSKRRYLTLTFYQHLNWKFKNSFCYFWLQAGGATKSKCDQRVCSRRFFIQIESKSKLQCFNR